MSDLNIGKNYTAARLRKEGIFLHWDEYAKTKCRWKILEMETIVKMCLDGHSRKMINYVLEGKPKTKTGKTRQRPLKIKRVGGY